MNLRPSPTTITAVDYSVLDVELNEPFGIASGVQTIARNVLVEIRLADGTVGIGEAAPFEAVSGETQASVLTTLAQHLPALVGQEAFAYRALSAEWWERCADVPTAIAGTEMALFDALARSRQLSLWDWFGRAEAQLWTDITIPTTSEEDPLNAGADAARRAVNAGFRTLKLKVGKHPLDVEVQRIRAIALAAPDVGLVLDANAGYEATEAMQLLEGIGALRQRVLTFEQPVARDDWDGLVAVERVGGVPVCADESIRSPEDLRQLVRRGAPSVINIKTAKLGVLRALEMAQTARTLGLRLMIGGMVETELAMSVSACLAAGLGGFDFVDLDTPLFMRQRPLAGGFVQAGPRLDVSAITRGHGVRRLTSERSSPPG